jgi:hypothetical protein
MVRGRLAQHVDAHKDAADRHRAAHANDAHQVVALLNSLTVPVCLEPEGIGLGVLLGDQFRKALRALPSCHCDFLDQRLAGAERGLIEMRITR